jgi:hypothetical protein
MDQLPYGRRAVDKLTLLDTSGSLTVEELADLKQLAAYWKSGRLAVGIILATGAVVGALIIIYGGMLRWVRG